VARAAATGSAADFLPERLSLPALRDAAAGCRGCHLWQFGTQTVFGDGARVLLDATAAQTLLGRQFRVTQHRWELLESDLAECVRATVHPSAILRGAPKEREAAFAAFVADLRMVGAALAG
jgi:uracil-DNA glycosylase